MRIFRLLLAAGCGILASTHASLAAAYIDTVLEDHPVAYWRLGEALGSTAQDHILGGSQNGFYFGAFNLGEPGALSGDPDTAVRFQGGSFITGNGTGDVLFANRSVITVELWLRPLDAASAIHYLEYGLSGFSLESETLSPKFYVNNVFQGSLTLQENAFTYVVLQLDGTNASIYQNGAPVSSVPWTQAISDSNAEFAVGSRNGNTRFVNADFDEVAIYNYALSASRIQAHYEAAPVAVPEADAWLLAAAGAAGIAGWKRRMR